MTETTTTENLAAEQQAVTENAITGETKIVTADLRIEQPAEAPAVPKVIVPTVGRRVHFWPSLEHAEQLGVFDPSQPCDAGVIYVHNERSVNLEVTGPSGAKLALQHVQLAQEADAYVEGESHAAWMPYQHAQAAKASA